MQLSPALLTQLGQLTSHNGPPEDLVGALDEFAVALTAAVVSVLAVTVTVRDGATPVSVTIGSRGNTPRTVRSSLVVRLPGRAGGVLTIVAARAGALRQLGADLPALLDMHRDRIALDTVFEVPDDDEATGVGADLTDAAVLNRALGVLLERDGMLPDEGVAALEERAVAGHTTIVEQARRVLVRLGLRPEEPGRAA